MKFENFRNLAADLITAFYEEEYERMSPYVKKGNTVFKKEGGSLKKVGTSKNPDKYMKALYANADKGKGKKK